MNKDMERIKENMNILKDCTLCPRNCHADRFGGQRGRCHETAEIVAARAALHMWEEPCISGDAGSGAVFFSGCSMGCIFCQNHNIAEAKAGKIITIERLSQIFLELQGEGAANINLVTPTHYVPQIIGALEMARKAGLALPVVYNTSGYEKPETIQILDGYVDSSQFYECPSDFFYSDRHTIFTRDFESIHMVLTTATIYYYGIDTATYEPKVTMLSYSQTDDCFHIDNGIQDGHIKAFEKELEKEALYLKHNAQ